MQPARLTPASALAAACAGAAAWCSAGTLAVTDAGVHAGRIGLLVSPWWLPASVAIALALAWLVRLSTDRSRPLFFSAVLVLPWLPVPLPTVLLIWAGPASWFVWAAIGAAMLAAGDAPRVLRDGLRPWLTTPSRAPWAAVVCAFLVYTAAAARLAPLLPGGDEPHYLIIAQSLWRDGDLRIENNHQRGDYLEYFNGTLRPDYLRRGQDGQIYSIHLPGVPALIAPVLAAGGYRLVADHAGPGIGDDDGRSVADDVRPDRQCGGRLVRLGLSGAHRAVPAAGVHRLPRRSGRHRLAAGLRGYRRAAHAPRARRRVVVRRRRASGAAAMVPPALRRAGRRAGTGARGTRRRRPEAVGSARVLLRAPGGQCPRLVRLLRRDLRAARSLDRVRALHADVARTHAGRARRAPVRSAVRPAPERAGVRDRGDRPGAVPASPHEACRRVAHHRRALRDGDGHVPSCGGAG